MSTKTVNEEVLMEAMVEALNELDCDDIAKVAQVLLGCRIAFVGRKPIGNWKTNMYNVTPIDGEYSGAFGPIPTEEE